jgi:hypothetical protein
MNLAEFLPTSLNDRRVSRAVFQPETGRLSRGSLKRQFFQGHHPTGPSASSMRRKSYVEIYLCLAHAPPNNEG